MTYSSWLTKFTQPVVDMRWKLVQQRQKFSALKDRDRMIQTEDFIHLSDVISEDASCSKDVDRRVGLAMGIVRKLHKIWKAKDISKSTNVLMYIILWSSQLSCTTPRRGL